MRALRVQEHIQHKTVQAPTSAHAAYDPAGDVAHSCPILQAWCFAAVMAVWSCQDRDTHREMTTAVVAPVCCCQSHLLLVAGALAGSTGGGWAGSSAACCCCCRADLGLGGEGGVARAAASLLLLGGAEALCSRARQGPACRERGGGVNRRKKISSCGGCSSGSSKGCQGWR